MADRELAPPGEQRRRVKTSERIAREITEFILANGLTEGERLPPEREMAASFRIARATLREALRLLETRGVIMLRPGPGGGPVVVKPRPDQLRDSLSMILQFEGTPFSEVVVSRAAIEPMLARQAAEVATRAELEELQTTIDKMRANLDDDAVFVAENARFHSGVAEASHTIVLRVFAETLKSIADGTQVGIVYSVRRKAAVADAHERILDALRDRNADAAEAAMRLHLEEGAHYWQREFPELLSKHVRWMAGA